MFMNLDSISIEEILLRRKALRRELSAREGSQSIRVAVLGGTTANEVVDLLELHLLASGFKPTFYISEYGQYFEDAVHDPRLLIEFKPDIVYLHTSCLNVQTFPPQHASQLEFDACLNAEMARYRQIWQSLQNNLSCQIIQNNFENPPYAILGNMDVASMGGRSRFLHELNSAFARDISEQPKLILQDIQGISSRIGLNHWFDWQRWFSYKILISPEGSLAVARSLCAVIGSIFGKSRKVLVLDLDNTLWGGVIGDDGVDKIQLGRETAVGEAYIAFQEYCLSLRNRGVLLAVCSKNNEETAKLGFEHPDSVLKLEHVSCFKANWEPKPDNILAIAKELNLGADSFVFVDDNPAERAVVIAQIDGIAVPDVGDDVSKFASIIEAGRYFESVSLSDEDLARASLYANNAKRAAFESTFADYGQYLDSLEMSAEIDLVKPVYVERVAQLTNKTNQFNLTTRRYTVAEIQSIVADHGYLAIYAKLSDRFGDNGLVSVVLGRKAQGMLHLDLWLMSCRVLKRELETALLDVLIARARSAGIQSLVGYYRPTKKNGMVAEHYRQLGFGLDAPPADDGSSTWRLDVEGYTPRNQHIKILEPVDG